MKNILIILVVIIIAFVYPLNSQSQIAGISLPVLGYEQMNNGVIFTMQSGKLKLQVFSDRCIHVVYCLSDTLPESSSLMVIKRNLQPMKWNFRELENHLKISTEKIQVWVNRKTGAIIFYDIKGDVVLQELFGGGKQMIPAEVEGESTFHATQYFLIRDNERFYGLGQHRSGLMNYLGHSIILKQHGEEIALPVIISNRGYGILWDNYSISECDFGKKMQGIYSIRSEVADVIDYYFILGSEIDEIINGIRDLTGTAPLFPKWAYGYWQCKERYKTQEELLEVARQFREKKIPIDLIVQDWRYWGKYPWNSFRFDEQNYPDPVKMIKILHEKYNLHFMLSVWPRFGQSKKGLESPIYDELKANGFLFPDPTNTEWTQEKEEWLQKVVASPYYDPFNEKARELYWHYMKTKFFDIGVDAWWLDCTEPELERNLMDFHSYQTAMGSGARYFNAYSLLTTKGVYEGQRQTTSDKRVCILTRSAYPGQQRYATVSWSGDIIGTWNTLRKQISAGLNFCISGLPYWTLDIGGFEAPDGQSDNYRELFIRWFQYGAFYPIFRTHGGDVPREPWQFGEEAEQILVQSIHLRYRLMPYIYSLAWKVTSAGYTIMRPLVMDFRNDSNVWNIDNQFMFGSAFLVNPVTEPKANHREVYLPESAGWYNFWSGKKVKGKQIIEAAAPIEKIPLYIKAGSIIPMGPFLQYATEKAADPIELRIYRGADAEFILYEDENDNYNYEKDSFATIPIKWNEAKQELIIGNRHGSYPDIFIRKTFHIVWVDDDHGVGVDLMAKPDRIVGYHGKTISIKAINRN